MQPVKGIRGEYSVSQRESSPWKSNKAGEVFLEHLTVGLTNIQIKDSVTYFDQAINGAKVEKQTTNTSSKIAAQNNISSINNSSASRIGERTILVVPRSLKDEMFVTLSWSAASDHDLALFADMYIDSEKGIKSGYHCQLGYTNPRCKGMEHVSSRDQLIRGDTIKISGEAFIDKHTGKVIPNKRVLLSVADLSKETDNKDRGGENSATDLQI